MKLSLIQLLLFLSALSIAVNTKCQAQIVTFSSTTTTITPAAPCDHVIQMLLRYGVNNQLNRNSGSKLVNHSLVTGGTNLASELGDLEILQVNALPPTGPSSGPRFAITVLNQSGIEARDFFIATVAILGQIQPNSPISNVKVDRIGPGEALEVTVQLPAEALTMGRYNGNALSYDKLIVAVDCFNRIIECDEANNVRLFEYGQVQRTASSNSPAASLRTQVPALNLLERQSTTFFNSGSADSHVSVDAPDLEQPTPDSLRSAIQSISPPPGNNVPVTPTLHN